MSDSISSRWKCGRVIRSRQLASLVIEPTTGVSVWIEQAPYDPSAAPVIDWTTGTQKITIAIDRDTTGSGPLSLRSEAPAEQGALIKVVGGKSPQ